MPDQRAIVLIPVPFTNLTSVKRRPVLVLSSDEHNRVSPDIVVAAITSNLSIGNAGIIISTPDLERGVLPVRSQIRADKIYTLSQGIIIKYLGMLRTATFDRVLLQLDTVLGR